MSKPNIVFVFADEHRQQALGCMHADPVVTPNFDRFAAQSRVLTHAVSNRPVCSPYRGMLFTGNYPHANGVLTNCHSESAAYGNYLRAEDMCVTDVLAGAGYDVGYIGKWHLDPGLEEDAEYTEGRRGGGRIWDSFTRPERRHSIRFWHAYGCCDNHMHPHYWHNDAPIDQRTDVDEWSTRHETDVAVSFLRNRNGERDADKPFALFISHNPPHMPFEAVPDEYRHSYAGRSSDELLNRPNVSLEGTGSEAERAVADYFAQVTGVDDQFGRLLNCLDEEGLAEDTIVVYTSDHGEMMGSHGLMHKVTWYDESLLVPFLVRWPGRIDAGRDDLLLSVPDIMPTLLAMAGCEEGCPADIHGRDLSGALTGNPCRRPESALYLNVEAEDPAGGWRGLRTHRYTLVMRPDEEAPADRIILHDCINDPWQQRNVAGEQSGVVRKLADRLCECLDFTGDPWRGREIAEKC